jgi:hypothetical protein
MDFRLLMIRTKIFVSSTYKDLKHHREIVIKALQWIKQDVGFMEIFPAFSEEPIRVCSDEIDESSIFVGIYAHHYGSRDSKINKSFTELEYDYARKIGIPTFCFKVEQNYPWMPEFIDSEQDKKDLELFFDKIKKENVIVSYKSPDDLAWKVLASVSRYLMQNYGTFHHKTIKIQKQIQIPSSAHLVHSSSINVQDTNQRCNEYGEIIKNILHDFINKLEMVTETDYNQIILVAVKTNSYRFVVVADSINSNKPSYRFASTSGLIAKSFFNNELINVRDVRSEPRYIQTVETTQSELVVPIACKNDIYGVFNSESDSINHFNENIVEKIKALAYELGTKLSDFGWKSKMDVDLFPEIHMNKHRLIVVKDEINIKADK